MNKLSRNWILLIAAIALILGGLGIFIVQQKNIRTSFSDSTSKETMQEERPNRNTMGNMMTNEQNIELKNISQSEQPLLIPPLLEPDSENDENISYNITAKEGEFQIKEGKKTKTLGYNGDFLGPVIRMKQGQKVTLTTTNQLESKTSFHWHGLKIPSEVDGGPHQVIEPGEKKVISFTVDQDASTLWFHPHPEGETASQVYRGLAGLMYIDDENSDSLNLPNNYGKDDIPLIVQDKSFDSDNQIDYGRDFYSDGTQGVTLLVNGTINPYIEVNSSWMRYRIISGSNSRNFTFSLKDNQPFYQIASDGGLLNSSTKLTSLTLSPGERAEILVDTSDYKNGDTLKLLANNTVALMMKINKNKSNTTFEPSKKLNSIKDIDTENLDKLDRQKIDLKGMSHMVSINNKQFDADRIDLYKRVNTQEVWEVNNISGMMGGMIHPFHIHGVQFQIISRNGQLPQANERGWKDTVVVNPEETVELLVEFDHEGVFMYHCHILEHEEYGMMGQMEIK